MRERERRGRTHQHRRSALNTNKNDELYEERERLPAYDSLNEHERNGRCAQVRYSCKVDGRKRK
jgi:hypothetical protein